jgi:malic enzyme
VEKFELEKTATGDRLTVNKAGPDLLRFPLYNKGVGFTHEERRALGIEALLPAEYNDIDRQSQRIFQSIFDNEDPVGRHIGLMMLQNRNEVLFYKVLHDQLESVMPIVYTPTVGKASQYYSRVFRRNRGLFITPDHAGRIEEVLRSSAPFEGVELMVVTDNESILGIGDQGAGGMAISVGKLALYCAGAGIHPARTMPVSLDVGTDNEQLLEDPLYVGYRQKRLRGDEYLALVDEFVAAVKAVFPRAMIQWEDFRKDNALSILERYRQEIPSFNDDIQGTGAVATACVEAACRIGDRLEDQRILIYGAGAAGLGIARQLAERMEARGLSGDEITRRMLVLDSRGILSDDRAGLDEYKRELAWPAEMAAELGLADEHRADLARIVEAYGATILVGTSGQAGAFDQAVLEAVSRNSDQPVVLPMSNPTAISEAVPEEVLEHTMGRALIATGSPFDPVMHGGGTQRIGQANNVFVFPGIGLGTIIAGAREITDSMISASGRALAESLGEQELKERCLVPEISRLWEVSGDVALAVAEQAVDDGVATVTDKSLLPGLIADKRWLPVYPEIVSTSKPGS